MTWLTRDGDLTNKPTIAGIKLPDSELPINVQKLGSLVYTVRYDDDLEIYLVVFRKDISLIPRMVKLHNVPNREETGRVAETVFSRLLSFDNNRLGNRDRNIILPIVRPLCRELFKGSFEASNKVFSYTVYKNMLTIFNNKGTGLLRVNYIKLSRSIKDNL